MTGVLKARTGPATWVPTNTMATVTLVPTHRHYDASATWTKPAGLVYIDVEVQGAGGGGGSAALTAAGVCSFGSGGAAGGYGRSMILAAALGATEAIVVGLAGAGGTAGGAGGAGGTSSFGTHVTATGGAGGGIRPAGAGIVLVDATGQGAFGGTSSDGQWVSPGQGGSLGLMDSGGAGFGAASGAGGNSFLGTGGAQVGGNRPGNSGRVFGGGGSGASNTPSQVARDGGGGANGCVNIVEWCQMAAMDGITEAAADARYRTHFCQASTLSMPVANNTLTTVTFDDEEWDPLGWHPLPGQTFTPKIAGWYRVTYNGGFTARSDQARVVLEVWKNSASLPLGNKYDIEAADAANLVIRQLGGTSQLIQLNGTTDYVRLIAFQTNYAAAASTCYAVMTVELVTPI